MYNKVTILLRLRTGIKERCMSTVLWIGGAALFGLILCALMSALVKKFAPYRGSFK